MNAMTAGCTIGLQMQPERLDRGYVVMLPGVENSPWQFHGTIRGLREAGIDLAFDIVEWGDGSDSLENLRDLARNQERARRIAFQLAGYQVSYPDRPVTLIGYSGGAGIAALAAESLPESVCLERLILIGAALSPDYDLSKARSQCRRGVVNFYSERDRWILGLGTLWFGTIDRRKTPSAGCQGFRDSSGALLDFPDLLQAAWRPDWARLGHRGNHVGWLSSRWAREVLADYLRTDSLGPEPP
jgi:pimeloyl-ACP methyl ester carboxylesterase